MNSTFSSFCLKCSGVLHWMPVLLLCMCVSCKQSQSQAPQAQSALQSGRDSCDDPDAHIRCSFLNMPPSLSHIMMIPGPGEKMIITGTLYKSDGKTPWPNVIMYAYHTDDKGLYSKSGRETGAQKWHGQFHGWCKTDSMGRYEIHSIRPAPYPDNTLPAHIHAAFKISEDEMVWINDFVFDDDPLVDKKYLASLNNPGGTGVLTLTKNKEEIWVGKRDIVLEFPARAK